MAENKKSFLLYADYMELFNDLSNEDAGKLIKHIFSYVNDEDPMTDEPIIRASFIPIKLQLKRDLRRWDEIREKRSLAGKKSAEARQQVLTNSTSVESVEVCSTNPTVNDTVTVTVNDTVTVSTSVDDVLLKKEPKAETAVFDFKKELLTLIGDKEVVDTWMRVRREKKAVNSKMSYDAMTREIGKTGRSALECVRTAAENSWKGIKSEYFPPLKPYEVQANKKQHSPPENDTITEQKSILVYQECLKNGTEWNDTPQLAKHIVKFLKSKFSIGEKNEIERIGKEAHEADRRKFGGYDYAEAVCYVNSGLANKIEL